MMIIPEAAAVSAMVTTARSETMMEGSAVMKPSMKSVMHGKCPLVPVVHGRKCPSGNEKAINCN